jgi:hypothetical protein
MKLLLVASLYFVMLPPVFSQDKKIYSSPAFSVFSDRVVQGKFEASALSDKHLKSNYKSPANEFVSSEIEFKFAINGKDNEMLPGVNHRLNVQALQGKAETPLIVFGKPLVSAGTAGYLAPDTRLTIKVDMREVLKQMNESGFYTTYKGDKIYKNDFKGLYVAGSAAPLMWDFDNLHNRKELQLTDSDGDGIYETTMMLNSKQDEKSTADEWKLSKNVAAFPQYSSDHTLINALYNMALEEMENAVEKDSTLRTGKEWAGVWTRDVSYSIILSMAYLQPKVAMNSLLRKVNKKKRIIQDTGTGGAWPISTDRMIWAVAAFEIYKVTGDKNWLKTAYEIIKNSIDDDLKNIYDAGTGLVKGESSFLDWREQTYPRWMQPADIFESACLGTNAAHYQANKVLATMASLLQQPNESAKYQAIAAKIKSGINKYLWVEKQGYYGQFLYGRNYKMLSPKSEALGEALAVLFDIADPTRQQRVVASTPITDYGISCIYPQIPGIPPYHNNAVWPFVQSYWLWAGAKVGNEPSVLESIAAIYRPAALFLTNKENFVADNGDFSGTQINSSNMLWSLSGNISIIHKVIFGIRFNENNLSFSPFVPEVLAGKRSLKNFRYRNAVLNIEMQGYGNSIKSFMLDGKVQTPVIPSGLRGVHQIRIILSNQLPSSKTINTVANKTALPSPRVEYNNGLLQWQPIENAANYEVFKNGKLLAQTKATQVTIDPGTYGEYQVIAIDAEQTGSFASEPIEVIPAASEMLIQAETLAPKAAHSYQGFSGAGFVELSTTQNKEVQIPIDIKEEADYAIDVRYANGNGPTNTENKCAIRDLQLNNKPVGTIVMPQRGKEEWSNWGMSNPVRVHLSKGKHKLTLTLASYNDNMNIEINQAMLDYIRLVKLN